MTAGAVKVAHLTSVHRIDDGRIFLKECRTLAAAGFDVTLVAPGDSFGRVDGVEIRAVPVSPGRLRRMTTTVWHVLRNAFRSGATVCHFHDPELMPAALLLKLTGRKVIYDVHEDLPAAILDKDWMAEAIRKLVSRLATGCEFASRWYVDAFVAATPHIARRFPKERTRLVQNYPFREELSAPAERAYADRRCNIAYLGGMVAIRGIREIVQAIELVDTPAARLVLVGEFQEPGLEQICRAESGWTRVDYRGRCSRSEVATILGDSRAGLVTYLPVANLIEAQPTKLFEYMSAGIPVIASDFPLWRRIIDGSACGILVDPHDPRAIAAAIQWLLDHPKEAEEMGRRGREAVMQVYNWEQESAQLLSLYEELLR